jgi:ABC-2 type transport system permease protein
MADAAGGRLPLYWAVSRRSFRRHSTYRGATFAGAFTNTVFGFIQVYVLLAVFRQRRDVGGLDAVDVVTFTFVTQGLLAVVSGFGPLELGERITSGDVVSDLYRPFDLQWWWLAQDVGRAAFQLLFRGIAPFAVGALAFDLRLPAGAGVWAAFALSLTLALGIGFAWRFALALSAFWLLDARGLVQLAGLVFLFFSGFLLPLQFFPGALRTVAGVLPFSAVVQLPVEVFLSRHRPPPDLLWVLARQAAWLVVLLTLGRSVMARAWRHVVVQGG